MSAYVAPVSDTSVFKKDIFQGKVVFATGGGSGICRGMVRAMMLHGCDAVVLGRQIARLEQTSKELSDETGKTCIPAQVDVRQPDTLKKAVGKTLSKFGRIDFVICGAAGNFLAPISGLSENAFKTVLEIDTLGTYNTIKATLEAVRKSQGAYIHVSATLHYNATPYQAHVSAAKAAVDALSNVLAVEEGPRGVRSNVISPGGIDGTEGMQRLAPQEQGVASESTNRNPLGRMGVIQDIAAATVFLFSDAASYITGQILPVDGGQEHLRTFQLPYPQSVLDPASVAHTIKARM